MKRLGFVLLLSLVCAAFAVQAVEQTSFSAAGVIESQSGGFKFPDGTIQSSAMPLTLLEQQTLFVHDDDYDRIGEVFGDPSHFLTSDGYLIRVDVSTGRLTSSALTVIYYVADNCEGQAYLSGTTSGGPGLTGGYIVEVTGNLHSPPPPTFARIEWYPNPQQYDLDVLSRGKPGACEPVDDFVSNVVPATLIDPGIYNIKEIGESEWGYKLPLYMVREVP
jgi:hypothetical protein